MYDTRIIDRIKAAPTVEELDELLRELSTFKHATPRTIRRAQRFAARRRDALLKQATTTL